MRRVAEPHALSREQFADRLLKIPRVRARGKSVTTHFSLSLSRSRSLSRETRSRSVSLETRTRATRPDRAAPRLKEKEALTPTAGVCVCKCGPAALVRDAEGLVQRERDV